MKAGNLKITALLLIALLPLILPGCAQRKKVFYDIPFSHKSFAAGHEGTMLPIVLPQKEAEAFSFAVVKALQEMEYSIVDPGTVVIPLPENTNITTDPVPLGPAEIEAHNASTSLSPIQANAIYRLSYSIKYGVNLDSNLERKHFELTVLANLERRGAGGGWHLYEKPYSAKFFASRLRNRIERYLIDG